jgi:glycosyltransferase involved in cell wall biosynthesis
MRVVMVTSDLPPDPGGIASHVLNLATSLREQGIGVAVVHQPKSAGLSGEYQAAAQGAALDYCLSNPPSATSRAARVLRRVHNVKRAVHAATAGFPLKETIVHFHDLRNTTVASLAIGGPKVWTNHTSQFYSLNPRDFLRCRLTTRVGTAIAPSNELARMTRNRLHIPTTFVPNGIWPVRSFGPSHRPAATGEFVCIVPRRMVHKNGIDVIVRAAEMLSVPTQARKWTFLIPETGADPSYSNHVRTLASRTPDHVDITFLGEVKPQSMEHLYRGAHASIIPSRIEAVSISALESLFFGLPVIASRTGGLLDALDSCPQATLVPPEDSNALVAALSELEQRPEAELAAIGIEAHAWVTANYSWSTIAQQTIKIYESLLG